ncbi:MAG: tRNA glutamyl-Q(34) synthetase GluQRS [Chloroflexi bacterium]|nr:tRNA glutamyl-Q(34) synthetase GluQRS [Chloroflexota bacterium]
MPSGAGPDIRLGRIAMGGRIPRPDLARLPLRPRTRFAPAPTGFLHLGHVANALWVWGLARVLGGRVLVRIEDHDRTRSRARYETALLEDLGWLGFTADDGPVRQSDDEAPYLEALGVLRRRGVVYGCGCSRASFTMWTTEHGRSWQGSGCPGACRGRGLDGPVLRVAMDDGEETWQDGQLGHQAGAVAPAGDPVIRDRDGHWTYVLSVVVDDLRQGVDLVVRGEDLRAATPGQLRLRRLLSSGGGKPPVFVHHPLIRRPNGRKLSKSAGDTGVRDLRAAGSSAGEIIGMAAVAVGLLEGQRSIQTADVALLFEPISSS